MSFRGPLWPQMTRYGLHAHRVTNVTLYTESSDGFVTSTAASIVTGWSEPVPGWESHPLKPSVSHGALLQQLRITVSLGVCTRRQSPSVLTNWRFLPTVIHVEEHFQSMSPTLAH